MLLLFSLAVAEGGEPSLKNAQQRLLRGNYAEARELFETLAKQPQHKIAAAIGICHTWQSEGEYDKALLALDSALKETANSADLLAARAEILFQRGRWDDAQQAAKAALTHNQNQFLAHWILAQINRDRGDTKKAAEELLWFVRAFAKQQDNLTDPGHASPGLPSGA